MSRTDVELFLEGFKKELLLAAIEEQATEERKEIHEKWGVDWKTAFQEIGTFNRLCSGLIKASEHELVTAAELTAHVCDDILIARNAAGVILFRLAMNRISGRFGDDYFVRYCNPELSFLIRNVFETMTSEVPAFGGKRTLKQKLEGIVKEIDTATNTTFKHFGFAIEIAEMPGISLFSYMMAMQELATEEQKRSI